VQKLRNNITSSYHALGQNTPHVLSNHRRSHKTNTRSSSWVCTKLPDSCPFRNSHVTQNYVTPLVSLICNFHLKIHNLIKFYTTYFITRFVQKVSGLTTVHEVDKAYGVLTLNVFNIVPFRSYTLRPTFLPLLETLCELIFQDV